MDKAETADYLSVSLRNLEGRLKEIPHFRLGAKTLFRKSELDRYMEQHRENPEAIDLERVENTTSDSPKDKYLSWEELVELEPRLDRLRKEIELIKDDDPSPDTFFCANGTWKQLFLWRFLELVGWSRKSGDPRLRTSEAYDVAHFKLYNLLPDCRNCWCMRLEDLISGDPWRFSNEETKEGAQRSPEA